MNRRKIILFFGMILLFLFNGYVLGEGDLPETKSSTSPAAYQTGRQTVNAGGTDAQSASYSAFSSVAQTAVGTATGASYQVGGGFWYGVSPGGGDCFCGGEYPSFGDVTCDNPPVVNPVDVVYMVSYVYQSQDARCYPGGWNCQYDLGDVNCDGAINPVDIVYYVNYVYKSLTPFPCTGCE